MVCQTEGCFYKLGGPFVGCARNKGPTILGSILGPLFFGKSPKRAYGPGVSLRLGDCKYVLLGA